MARRRHYRGLVRFPGLSGLALPSGPVKPADVVVGAGLGIAGSLGLQAAAGRLIAGGAPIPAFLASGSPVVGGLATGAALYYAQRKKNRSRAVGHFVGSALAGLSIWAAPQIAALLAGVTGGAVAGFGAPLFMNPRLQGYGFSPRTLPAGMGGPIFNNPRVNLSKLARLQGMGDENEDGMFPAP